MPTRIHQVIVTLSLLLASLDLHFASAQEKAESLVAIDDGQTESLKR